MTKISGTLKTHAVWGYCEAKVGGSTMQVGWVRCRTADGANYVHVGNGGQPGAISYPDGISAFCRKVERRAEIDLRYWRRESGPVPQETSREIEYEDANRFPDVDR